MRSRAATSLVLTFLALVSPLNASQLPDGKQDEAAIRALIEEVETANNAGDVQRWVGLFAEGAVYMAPGAPAVTTREGLVEVAEAGFRHDASIELEPLEIEVCEDWAFARSTVTGTVTLHQSGDVVPVDIKQIVIYVRESDGQWRVARMISNSNRE
jgi:uncharacterized protein (TIGR02246 family)